VRCEIEGACAPFCAFVTEETLKYPGARECFLYFLPACELERKRGAFNGATALEKESRIVVGGCRKVGGGVRCAEINRGDFVW